jgi:C4-dicarboxylate-specific signal transduction histidine kinase
MFNLKDEPSHLELERLEPLIGAENRERIQERLNVTSENAGEQELQFRVLPASDARRWLLAPGRCETDASGTQTNIQGVAADVTDQHRTEEELDELRLDLAHVGCVTALGELAFSLAHELRQPLASILNNVQVAQMMLQTPEADIQQLRDILADIYRDDRRAGDVIDRMRAMMSHRALAFEPVAVDSLLKDVVSLVRGDAVRRGVQLEAQIGPEPLIAYGDRVHLSQVLINLILNAMDAMIETPAARKRVAMTARATLGDSIEISVADCGPGVAPEITSRIFEPLFTTKVSGMGVGLAVSRTIIDSHHGRLWVESNPDGGATFRVAIPATRLTTESARGTR